MSTASASPALGDVLLGDASLRAAAEALERSRPAPTTLDEYARFVKSFEWTAEQLLAIPTHAGVPRFTLD